MGGCDLVVGIGVIVGTFWVGVSPICGIEAMRAQWSLWVVGIVVMVASAYVWVAVGGTQTVLDRSRRQRQHNAYLGTYPAAILNNVK